MERISVPAEVKNALFGMRLPGEKVGDVIARLVRDARHDAFIRHLDQIAASDKFVTLDSDPEIAEMLSKRTTCTK